jgi:predicted CxxxxCH...CXXCH cytochrome family protein
MCHGGVDSTTGAPPKATWGNAADPVRVGAHTRHLAGSANAPAVACASCHAVPADALAAGHVGGATATVTFGGQAVAGNATPRWDRATATCATTYCHGGYQGTFTYQTYDWGLQNFVLVTVPYAGNGTTPIWTGGPMTCSSCHGAPPANGAWHDPGHGGPGQNACSLCHPGVNAAGTAFTDPSRHLNGTVDVTPVWTSTCFGCH